MWEFITACFVFVTTAFFILLSFFLDYEKGKPLSTLQKFAIFLFLAVSVYGIRDTRNKFISAEKDKREILDTVTKKATEVKSNTESVGAEINRKIDSVKVATVDSMKGNNKVVIDSLRGGNDAVVKTLQKTIKDQDREIDSLIRSHAEKHLTNVDKKEILWQLDDLGKRNNGEIHVFDLDMCLGSNGQIFASELFEFLQSKGYEPGHVNNTDNRSMGYHISLNAPGWAIITIGFFDLSK
jgi:hypothetical protein